MFGNKIGRSQFLQRDDDTFTFINNTVTPEVYGILANSWVEIAFPFSRVPVVAEQQDYNQLVFDMEMTPKKIKGIRLLLDTFNSQQLSNPLQWVTQDSSGNYKSFVDYPINLLALDQYQDRLVDIYYKDLTIGGNQWLFYKINALTTLKMTFIYDDFRLENLLDKENPRQVIYSNPNIELFDKLL